MKPRRLPRVYVWKQGGEDVTPWWVDCEGCREGARGVFVPVTEKRTHADAMRAACDHLRRKHRDV
ncbi:hypothetical protein [Nocardioides sp.]|uniref:hypothetical protein n=1 Tax=Nocardioides sp. TaxID=35761 RepID=UPI0035131593